MYNHRTMAYYTRRRKRTFMLKFRHIGKNAQNSLTRWFYIYLWSNMDILIFSQQKLYFRYALFKATLRVTMIRTSFGLMLKLFWFNWFLNNTTCDDFLSQNKPTLHQDIRKRFVFLVYLSGTLSLETISLRFPLQWFHLFACFHLSSFHSWFSLNITFTSSINSLHF